MKRNRYVNRYEIADASFRNNKLAYLAYGSVVLIGFAGWVAAFVALSTF